MTLIELLGKYRTATLETERLVAEGMTGGASSDELFELLKWQGNMKHHYQVLVRFMVYPFIAPDLECGRLTEQAYINNLCHDLTVKNANTLSHILLFLSNAYSAYVRWDSEHALSASV
ncbi:hypothetical protein [Larsenimonas salina]|uniref:hypothetical protein n=1 Tax=Larsenimonas salina TaxID=1295565 RepID=UPI002073362D|nr:hypothetical protein [Larsenimonas salina]MCM5703389.1 hypothetical protein [Larsenimonas salina]